MSNSEDTGAVIKFKSTRRMHPSGFRVLEKSGDLEYDLADSSTDVVWITVTEPQAIKIDCRKDGTYRLLFIKDKAYLHNPPTEATQERKEALDE